MTTTYTPFAGSTASRQRSAKPASTIVPSSATPTIDSTRVDFFAIRALAVAITGVTVTGSPVDGQRLTGRIKDNGSARALAWGAAFEAGSVALPTTTTAGKTLYVEFVFDAVDSKWACERAASRA